MTRRRGGLLAAGAAVWAVSWALALAGVLLAWLHRLPEVPVDGMFLALSPTPVLSRFDDIGTVVALIYGPLAGVLIARRPHPVAILLAVHAVGSGITSFGVQYALLGEQVPGLPLYAAITQAAGWAYLPGTVGTTVIPLLLTRARLSTGSRVLVGVGIALAALSVGLGLVHRAPPGSPSPLALACYAVIVYLAVCVSVATAVVPVTRWIRTARTERGGLGWLVIGHLFLTLSYVALVLPADPAIPSIVWDFGVIAPVVGQIFYSAAVLVMGLGQRLWGIDVAVSRVLLWAILTVVAAAAYLGLVAVLSRIVDWGEQTVGIAAAAVVALALQPVRHWLQRRVDSLVYGEGTDPVELVRSLGRRVGELDSGMEGLEELVRALHTSLRLGSLAVRSAGSGPSAESGTSIGVITRVPLFAGPAVIGWIDATATDRRRLPSRVRRSIEELSGVVAAALQLVEASAELERLRDGVLAVRQQERREIRRELHDGIGPALAGIGFGLAAVDNLLGTDPAAGRALAARLAGDLRERLTDVRALARTMRPATEVLDLAGELHALAADFAGAGPDITVDAEPHTGLDARARRSAYLIAAEALHNAVRHAGATTIEILLSRQPDGTVDLSITDDGSGFSGADETGVGMASMRERAGDVGAEFGIRSSPTGTRVEVRFVEDARLLNAERSSP